MAERVLIIGGGSREHALADALLKSPRVGRIFVAPGNGGTERMDERVENVDLDIKDNEAVVEWCRTAAKTSGQPIGLVVVGPEDPLERGLADALRAAGIPCFGPSQAAAQIECSKVFSKEFMERYGIPTARYSYFTEARLAKQFIRTASFPALVIKASGLAAGKGVVVSESIEEACRTVDMFLEDHAFGDAGDEIVVEEVLQGDEVSVIALTDGTNFVVLPAAQDHKRAYDGDKGPNTGGMGAYAPCPLVDDLMMTQIRQDVIGPTVEGLRAEGKPFVGALYAGLMITWAGPKVLEFNCRFGDPETQSLLPLLDADLFELCMGCVNGTLASVPYAIKADTFACGVVIASGGYPASSTKGVPISGIEKVENGNGMKVYQAATEWRKGPSSELVTSGGRVLTVVSVAESLPVAAERALAGADTIQIDKSFHRRDIAQKGLNRVREQLSYKSAGVDIEAGNELVRQIKRHAASTNRSGVCDQLGGFGALFDLKAAGYEDNPILVSGTDGVGTKLRLAIECQHFDTVGIDLVAMCVNDILVQGAEPLFFLDYFATASLDVSQAAEVIKGIAMGCHQAGCALVGGETAEMPGMYAKGDFDLAGFAVGAVQRSALLPRTKEIRAGDLLIGLPSSGVHSNGFSLVRRILNLKGLSVRDTAPFDNTTTVGQALLTPTRIYVKSLLPVLKLGYLKALCHITGGGLVENVPRILPASGVEAVLDAKSWSIPPVFRWIHREGQVPSDEMLKTFNCGLGMVLVTGQEEAAHVMRVLKQCGENPSVVGRIEPKSGSSSTCRVDNFPEALVAQPLNSSIRRKRVAVFISGTGTNLQALIDYTTDPSRRKRVVSQIVLVISNRPGAKGLERAQRAGIPTKVIPSKGVASRVEYDMLLHRACQEANVDLIALAGFMRIVSAEFISLWPGRILNVHPSLLPAFKGMHAYGQALEAGCRLTGCTVHFVEPILDAGPIIAQESVPILVDDTLEALEERGKRAEHRIYPRALEMVASERVKLTADGRLQWNL